MRESGSRPRRGERGIVLLLALIALLLIAAVGAAIMFMASSESAIVGAQKVGARSYYAGAGGLEEARYRLMPSINNALGGINAKDTVVFARVPVLPPPGVPPSEILYIVNANNPGGGNFDAVGSIPPASEDTFRAAEVPAAITLKGVASIQPNAGNLNRSVPYRWVRINLKTELAAQQDLNLDGFLDQDPIFLFMGRQYRGSDLLVYDFDGLGAGGPGFNLPPPWGPDPLLQAPPITDRPCVAVICATPVFMLTARSEVPLPGAPPTSRLIRAEVAVPFSFSIDAGILSEAGIDVQGQIMASGRDICNPACAQYAGGAPYAFPPWPPSFNSSDVTTVPAACNYVVPVQSESPAGAQKVTNTAAKSDPHCNPGVNPSCVCSTSVSHAGTTVNSCVLANAPPKYDLDQLISILKPLAEVLRTPVNSYYPQVGTSNLSCGVTGCQGQGLELGGFPFADPVNKLGADPVNGVGADPIITYVPGDLKCTSTCTGAGILIVDGNLELSASMAFYGTVLVRGNVTVLGGGSPPTPCNIYGSLISQGGVATDLGGGICFQYNSCAQRNASFFAPTLNLSYREMPQ